MNTNEILSHVDHTLLKATATWEQIKKIAEESIEYGTASICIPQCYLKRLNETYGDKVNLCTVLDSHWDTTALLQRLRKSSLHWLMGQMKLIWLSTSLM